MNCDVTISRDDWKTLHNTLCELRSIAGDMERSLIKVERIESVIQGFETALKDAYEQDHSAFDRKFSYFNDVQTEMKLRSVWSVYEIEDFYTEHPYKGATTVVYDQHWGGEVVEEPIEGPLWIDLYRAADAAIKRSGDEHHVFIEQFSPVQETNTLKLYTGS